MLALPLGSTGAEPSTVAPSVKVTVPLGMPLPGAATVTVAAKVTGSPAADGLGELMRTVLVAAATTWRVTNDDVA